MFNEMLNDANEVRPAYRDVKAWIDRSGVDFLSQRNTEAEALFRRIGITFAVYGEGGDPERLIPFDLVPRVFSAEEWRRIVRGVVVFIVPVLVVSVVSVLGHVHFAM